MQVELGRFKLLAEKNLYMSFNKFIEFIGLMVFFKSDQLNVIRPETRFVFSGTPNFKYNAVTCMCLIPFEVPCQ